MDYMNAQMEKEVWKDIPGFEFYEVSTFGRVRSKERLVNNCFGTKCCKRTKILKGQVDTRGKGYWIQHLFKGPKGVRSHSYSVHRLVAMTFIPNPDNKPCVNHIDGDCRNNKLSNLEWVTYLENSHHYFKKDGFKTRCSLTEDEKRRISNQFSEPIKIINIRTKEEKIFAQKHKAAEYVGVGRSAISMALKHNRPIRKTFLPVAV